MQTNIGLIGLAVMGKNLVLNMIDHGFSVSVYNRTPEKTRDFLKEYPNHRELVGFESLEDFVNSLERPRKIMLMIQAGKPVDQSIHALLPFLEPGDVIIDGGNSYFKDSERRCKELQEKGILFLGVGISGGEEGARHGPSIMPGGNPEAWPLVAPIFQSIAAKVQGRPCCSWVGTGGAGHYVKAVHNGIEYGDIQLICEAYGILRDFLKLSATAVATILKEWNTLELESYLIRIASEVLALKDPEGIPVIDTILDVVGQKGTGKWTAIDALNSGVPLSLIIGAVLARFLSSWKEIREQAARNYPGTPLIFEMPHDPSVFIQDVFHALYASKIISYAQGFMLLGEASKEYNWGLDLGEIALMWRGGCIIQSAFLDVIHKGFAANPENTSLIFQEYFRGALRHAEMGWRRTVVTAIGAGLPIPCLAAAITFYDGYRTASSSMSLAQGLRDYFGAHTYERNDRPRGEFYHTDWVHTKTTERVK
ncbi:phosphogluconate dehydrogenase [Chlamydia pneumoniae TW-183]|uniref:6-phosphogluconate dehydrogenase, decarboxylating n=2 Tax=Chlamydia pneumoniae TaxID=83558 RepID=6PGD_CHLPN|nr:decarboxylating NADP(+)-dependent phosphogluconate dehydrogenase [Chlamydia pneumoniae]Q9Z8I3.1 RecName: Full=6-phosphogluconate dehydrogenase, decarboxylating [Chlamydia pneumoniae]AAD18504.1 6-Phosphogluconate Dehydrogenase [Chlamydia pneumoniae CWL029]AAF38243.1 6-phosphogluconate dehydrogenase, decarboxylating [Chlamydia pneumoniae AR39]AAP98300.1 phosphogluconate dehydrogenase [Chlamydia pneumoniae TW-183]CRI32860.1 6-phosphogluconate dehydrogenase, decarboxylating [Chlamydia pneumonia